MNEQNENKTNLNAPEASSSVEPHDDRHDEGAVSQTSTTDREETVVDKENSAQLIGEARRVGPELSDEAARSEMGRRARRSFLVGGVAAIAAYGGWRWLKSAEMVDGIPYPLRQAHMFNEKLSRAYFDSERMAQTFTPAPNAIPRVNGGIGFNEDFNPEMWRLHVTGLNGSNPELSLTLDDIKGLPRVEMTTQIKCIEGWSDMGHWTGARFSDFAARYAPDSRNPYISLETPDGGYYVGLEIESALHPQTILCYEMGGAPLTPEHGAPLRLYVPVKYGIKSLKRIGKISFTDERPRDYWAEQGYDWYSGH